MDWAKQSWPFLLWVLLTITLMFLLAFKHPKGWLQNEIYYFNTTDQWKSSEQAHSSTNNRKFSFCICPFILHSKIKTWCLFDSFHTFMITSKVGVLKDIFTSLRFTLCWKAKKENAHHKSLLYGRVLTIEKPKFT